MLFSGNEFTKDRFFNEYRENEYLHIATHGYINTKIRDDVYFLCRKNNYNCDTIWGFEILKYISKVKIVTLSVCNSANGYYESIGGTYNLARYFKLNGALMINCYYYNLNDFKKDVQIIKFL